MPRNNETRQLHQVALAFTALLALSLPFELVLLQAGPVRLSNLELLLGVVAALVALLVWRERRWQQPGWLRIPRSWLWLGAIFAGAVILSAVLAPEFRFNALKATLRLFSGMTLALLIPQLVFDRRDLLWVVVPLLVGGLTAAILGLVEMINGQTIPALDLFRESITAVGPFLRLTGPFSHANQAAMFLEGTLPLLVALSLILWQRNLWAGLATVAAVALYLQAAVLTYSRASIATILLSSAFVAGILWWRRNGLGRWRRAWPWAGVSLSILFLIALNLWLSPVMRLRVSSEGDADWYNLSFDVPQELQLEAGHTLTTTVTVHNEGLLTWADRGPNLVWLGAHWFLENGSESLGFVPRWSLPEPVGPGESITLDVPIRAPQEPGNYRLQWDMVHEDVTWFSAKSGVFANTEIVVRPAEQPPPPTTAEEAMIDMALSQVVEAPADMAPIPGRRTLWRIALNRFLERPLLGIGLDNYRLVYGEELGHETWNMSIHTNNWYVEVLVSLGLLGTLPFLIWVVSFIAYIIRTLRDPRSSIWQAAIAVGVIAFFGHGLLDYFILFNDTGMLFWLLTGLWISQEIIATG